MRTLQCATLGALIITVSSAQAPKPPAPARPAASRAAHPEANLQQLMRGILFPASNVIFAAQSQDPAAIPPAKDPSMSSDLLTSTYGKWDAVENSSLALAEVANLLTVPGRKCANGRPVPINNPDWAKYVQGLRDAGRAAYKAAQSKSQDNIVAVAETVTTACSNCHDRYREKPDLADRCK